MARFLLILVYGNQYPSIAATGSSVGTKQGFSIVKFNSGTASGNQTIPHKLDNVPSLYNDEIYQ